MRALNLACGDKIVLSQEWTNVDHKPANDQVKRMNLLKPLLYPDEYFDVIYHSQFIEHLNYSDGQKFLAECYRVLKSGGIMRIVTPDLENQTTEYLNKLRQFRDTPEDSKVYLEYQWIKNEMLDQLSRNYTGGGMKVFLESNGNDISDYIVSRLGRSGKNLLPENSIAPSPFTSIYYRIKKVFSSKACRTGKFRLGGEVHLTMYDEISLAASLRSVGFKFVKRKAFNESDIVGWSSTLLDNDLEGLPDNPESLFMECTK